MADRHTGAHTPHTHTHTHTHTLSSLIYVLTAAYSKLGAVQGEGVNSKLCVLNDYVLVLHNLCFIVVESVHIPGFQGGIVLVAPGERTVASSRDMRCRYYDSSEL